MSFRLLNSKREAQLRRINEVALENQALHHESPKTVLKVKRSQLLEIYSKHEEIIEEMYAHNAPDDNPIKAGQEEFDKIYRPASEHLNILIEQIKESENRALQEAARTLEETAREEQRANTLRIKTQAIEDLEEELLEIYQLREKEATEPLPATQIPFFIATCSELLARYDIVHGELVMMNHPEDTQRRLREERKEFRRTFTATQSWLASKMPATTARIGTFPDSSQSTTSIESRRTTAAKIKLPTIVLPSYNGAPDEWVSFRDTFNSLVHLNDDLSGSSKFRYLKTSITDKLSPIAYTPESDEGYQDAWDTVVKFYENKRRIVDTHFVALFTLKKMNCETSDEIQRVINEVRSHVSALQRMNTDAELFQMIIAQQVIHRLDPHTRDLYESDKTDEIPTWIKLLPFLEKRQKVLNTLPKQTKPEGGKPLNTHKQPLKPVSSLVVSKNESKPVSKQCPSCCLDHYLSTCPQFKEFSVPQRWTKVRELNLCFNCLGKHRLDSCSSRFKCRSCGQKHHNMLHSEPKQSDDSPSTSQQSSAYSWPAKTTLSSMRNDTIVFLSTAVVSIQNRHGHWHQIRVLLDSGSDANFITKPIAEALGFPLQKTCVEVNGIGNSSLTIDTLVNATVASRSLQSQQEIEFLVINRAITGKIPAEPIIINSLQHLPESIVLADPTFDKPNKIDALIGNEVFLKLIRAGQLTIEGGPILQETIFGWILGGKCTQASKTVQVRNFHLMTRNDLKNSIEKFYKEEDYRNSKGFLTDEEQHCETFFEETYKRKEDGRFVVQIPLKESARLIANNRNQAMCQFLANEKRLAKNERLQREYVKFMREYESLGHMTEVDPPKDGPIYYLPHHAVENPESTTTKVRIVFNASSKTSSGISFNNAQCIGPQIQTDSFALTLKFRLHATAIKADIAKMYRQIEVCPTQRNLQLILWRESPASTGNNVNNHEENSINPVKTYALNTVTYGTASASFLSTRCIKQLAIDNKDTKPQAAAVIENDFYVDDLVSGAATPQDAIDLFKDVTSIISSAQMKLRKVSSNSKEFLHSIPIEDREELSDNTVKTLGVKWNTATDEIEFNIQPMDTSKITKRKILSEISKIYDPVGLLGPVTFKIKLFMRDIWQTNLGWDEEIPENLQNEWLEIASNITDVNMVKVPRAVVLSTYITFQLHAFSDAAKGGFGCCVYIRTNDASGNCAVRLLCAKSRIAPTQPRSIARLELCGIVILSHLVQQVEVALKTPIHGRYAWSDSAIALHWIKKPPSSLQPYVANRVNEIQEMSSHVTFRHVRGADNPADLISRGLLPSELVNNHRWWNGPEFLLDDESDWPSPLVSINPEDPVYKSEFKKIQICAVSSQPTQNNSLFDIVEASGTLRKALRKLALTVRFIHNLRAKKKNRPKRLGRLGIADYQDALLRIAQVYQTHYLSDDIIQLKSKDRLPDRSKLHRLAPFWDQNDQIIRVGGRLANAHHLNKDQCHQILIPKSHFARLLIRSAHVKNLHCGQQATLGYLMTQFWIINAKSLIRSELHKCIRCFRSNPRMMTQFMGQLPQHRVTPAPAFSVTGVDYAGPILIKTGGPRSTRSQKSYVAVFVCFVTKAIHLELVTDLTTKAFLACLDRFISRRGLCSKIYSDNGKNFIGAANQFKELYKFLQGNDVQAQIHDSLAARQIEWHFIPPKAPEQGGLWEAGVKSMKHHLTRVTQEAHFNYEEMVTVLNKIEFCLNSRPLMPLSPDPNDLQPLTPGHFLIGQAMNALPLKDLRDIPCNRLQRWDRITKVQQQFWDRWQRDVIHQLQIRNKNFKKKLDVQVGQLVLIQNEALPSFKWPLARIHRIIPGKDGITRVVELKTSTGFLIRPITQLALLPTDDECNTLSSAEHVEI